MSDVLFSELRSVRRPSGRRTVVASVSTGLMSFVMLACAQPVADTVSMGQSDRTYAPSARFEAVTFYVSGEGGLVVASPAKAAPLRIDSRIGDVIVLPSLEKYGVVLIRLADNADLDELDRAVSAYNSGPQPGRRHRAVTGRDRREGNPVYASGSVDRLLVNEVIVRFRAGTERRAIEDLFASLEAEFVTAPEDPATDSYLVRFPGRSGHDIRKISNELDRRPDVAYAQPNFVIIDHRRLPGARLASAPVSCLTSCPAQLPIAGGDPFLAQQWHLRNNGDDGVQFADINAQNAWKLTKGKSSVVIAILDDLVEIAHEDLVGKVLPVWNAFDVNGSMAGVELTPLDVHGTALAGLAAATTGNGKGIAGAAPEVKILPIRTFNPTTTIDTVKRAIDHAADHADVLSMSWDIGDHDANDVDIDQALLNAANVSKRVLVFSAGNEEGNEIGYPASRADDANFMMIVVSATNRSDALQTVANSPAQCAWGSQTAAHSVAAPGVDLVTTDRSGAAGYCNDPIKGSYTRFSGTSGSAPLVAAVAALIISRQAGLSPSTIRNRLQQTAWHPSASASPAIRPWDLAGWGLGWGRIDACVALGGGESCAERSTPSSPTDLVID